MELKIYINREIPWAPRISKTKQAINTYSESVYPKHQLLIKSDVINKFFNNHNHENNHSPEKYLIKKDGKYVEFNYVMRYLIFTNLQYTCKRMAWLFTHDKNPDTPITHMESATGKKVKGKFIKVSHVDDVKSLDDKLLYSPHTFDLVYYMPWSHNKHNHIAGIPGIINQLYISFQALKTNKSTFIWIIYDLSIWILELTSIISHYSSAYFQILPFNKAFCLVATNPKPKLLTVLKKLKHFTPRDKNQHMLESISPNVVMALHAFKTTTDLLQKKYNESTSLSIVLKTLLHNNTITKNPYIIKEYFKPINKYIRGDIHLLYPKTYGEFLKNSISSWYPQNCYICDDYKSNTGLKSKSTKTILIVDPEYSGLFFYWLSVFNKAVVICMLCKATKASYKVMFDKFSYEVDFKVLFDSNAFFVVKANIL
uniref:Uncharacterized protein n=1 Tax=Megaviridae environmental sample TaxID=1737588 RepID=A0A5J6VIQ9_9VIRU|nr:MAG: hypothetical protein [Megaviridae environmental sample]